MYGVDLISQFYLHALAVIAVELAAEAAAIDVAAPVAFQALPAQSFSSKKPKNPLNGWYRG